MNPNALFDGPGARLVARVMAHRNRDAEHEAVTTLDPQPADAVVAIGSGAGVGVAVLAARVATVVAVDPSQVMVEETIRRNRAAIERGTVEVHRTTAEALPLPDESMDGAIAVNFIQLWEPLEPSMAEVARVLRPGGRLVTFTHDWAIERSSGHPVDDWLAIALATADRAGLAHGTHWRGNAEKGHSVALTLLKPTN